MLQTEFFERTGMELSAEEFAKVHNVYVGMDEMDKDAFCAFWMHISDLARLSLVNMTSNYEARIANIIASNNVQLEQKQQRIYELLNEKDEMVDFVYGQVKCHDEYEMKDFCKEHMGEGEFYARLIDDDEADSDDMERIAELLRENC